MMLAAAVAMPACDKQPDAPTSAKVTIVQYDEIAMPLVGHGVTLYLGDVSNGNSAEIRVKGPGGETLAVDHLTRGDELAVEVGGVSYVVTALDFEDNWVADEATLRIERRAPLKRPRTLRVAQRSSDEVPGLPGVQVSFGDIEQDSRADLTVIGPGGTLIATTTATVGDTFEFEHAGARYRLTLAAFEGHASSDDHALVQIEKLATRP